MKTYAMHLVSLDCALVDDHLTIGLGLVLDQSLTDAFEKALNRN